MADRRIARGGLPEFSNASAYFVYYGNWTPKLIESAKQFQLAVVHPNSNIDREVVRRLQEAGGTVLGYLSIGEDQVLHVASASGGKPGIDGIHASWYYYDDSDRPLANPQWNSYYTRPSDQHWQHALKYFRNRGNQGWYGYRYIIETLGCDGLFLDTIDTHCPQDWGGFGDYEGIAALIELISSDIGPRKLVMINRGLYLFDDAIVRPSLTERVRANCNAVMIENFAGMENLDRWISIIGKQSAKPDGFSVVTLDYMESAIDRDRACENVIEALKWTPYFAEISLRKGIDVHAVEWTRRHRPAVFPNPRTPDLWRFEEVRISQ